MTKKNGDKEFAISYERLSDQVPLDEEETADLLASIGIDTATELKRALEAIDRAAEEQRQARFAGAREARTTALARLRASVKLGKGELLSRLAELQKMLPPDQQPHVFHKNLESVSEDDLASLVAEYEELIDREE